MIDFFTPLQMEDQHDTGWHPAEGIEDETEMDIENQVGAFCD